MHSNLTALTQSFNLLLISGYHNRFRTLVMPECSILVTIIDISLIVRNVWFPTPTDCSGGSFYHIVPILEHVLTLNSYRGPFSGSASRSLRYVLQHRMHYWATLCIEVRNLNTFAKLFIKFAFEMATVLEFLVFRLKPSLETLEAFKMWFQVVLRNKCMLLLLANALQCWRIILIFKVYDMKIYYF